MKNALTIDLEDYYQVTAFEASSGPDGWDSHVSRVEANTAKLLELLSSANCKATFFTLGWVAEKHPKLIRDISELGHEIACHSHLHRRVYSLTPSEFKEDTRRAKEILENASGIVVRGYRAPSFSITRDSWWAFKVLAELGFSYDSSIFPIKHANYGMPDMPRFPFRVDTPAGSVIEFPMPTLAVASVRSPFGGGAYFRLLPYRFTRWAIRRINALENQPVCVYLHPWEIDTGQPLLQGTLTSRARHYFGLKGTESKLKKLLGEFEFCPLASIVNHLKPEEVGVPALVP